MKLSQQRSEPLELVFIQQVRPSPGSTGTIRPQVYSGIGVEMNRQCPQPGICDRFDDVQFCFPVQPHPGSLGFIYTQNEGPAALLHPEALIGRAISKLLNHFRPCKPGYRRQDGLELAQAACSSILLRQLRYPNTIITR